MRISVVDPISAAIHRARYITFQPFNLGKWFVLGFIVWLATLGEGGCGGGAGGGRSGGGGGPAPGTWSPGRTDDFHEVTDWFWAHLAEIILIGTVAIGVILLISLVIMWINSRARFMFIEAVANNTYEVKSSWHRYRELGNSLFVFRAWLLIIGMALGMAVLAVCVMIAWPDLSAGQFESRAMTAIIAGIVLGVPLGLAFGIVNWCTNALVTPIMYAGNQSVLPAWREFRADVVTGHVGTLVLFLLMQIVLSLAVLILSMVIGCVTCCIGFLPYLSTVATLPLVVFDRCYSLYFLQQFGPRYVIIQEPQPPGAFPVMGLEDDRPPWPPSEPLR